MRRSLAVRARPARRRGPSSAAVVAVAVVLLLGCSPTTDEEAPTAPAAPDGPPSSSSPQPSPVPLDTFPDETTTGVPEGTVLTPSGSLVITEAGTVIDGLEITGTVTVKADDVVIRNSLIRNTGRIPVRVDGGKRLLVEDTEIDGQGRADPAVAFSNYTLRRVHIHGAAEGPRIAGSNVTIEDSYIHDFVQVGDNHMDAIQMVSGKNAVIRGNHVSVLTADGGLGNAAFMFGAEHGAVQDCLVENNYLNGGNYTVNGGGGGGDEAGCTFDGNVIGEDHRYGAVANLGPDVVWERSNLRAVDGTPVSDSR